MSLQALFLSYPAFYITAVTVLGLLVGSFLNVVSNRLPVILEREWKRECSELLGLNNQTLDKAKARFNLITPGSHCPHCGHKITALENIPLVSYVALGGKCSQCGNAISLQYPAVEATSGLLSLVIAWHFGFSWQALAALLLTWALIALSVIDLKSKLLPDIITLTFLWLGLILSMLGIFTDLQSSVLGAVAGYLSLWAVYQLFRLITGKEGMGYGDFKLLAMLGAWLGWQLLPVIILLSSLVGTLVGASLIILKHLDRNIPIPFGPYLAVAGWIALLWGNDITQAYLDFSFA